MGGHTFFERAGEQVPVLQIDRPHVAVLQRPDRLDVDQARDRCGQRLGWVGHSVGVGHGTSVVWSGPGHVRIVQRIFNSDVAWSPANTPVSVTPPQLIEDAIGHDLVAPEQGWEQRGDMDPDGTAPYRLAIVARTRYVEDLLIDENWWAHPGDEIDRPGLEAAARGAADPGAPWLSFSTPDEIVALAESSGFAEASAIPTDDIVARYADEGHRPATVSDGAAMLLARI